MNNDDEFERLLGEIPRATSPLNHHRHNNLVDHHCHGYGYASCVSRRVNGYGDAMYDDELLMQKYARASSSPVSGFSLQSDGSSSSLFSGGGGLSLSDIGSPSPPQIETLNGPFVPGTGFRLDFNNDDSNFLDDFNLSRRFSRMCVNDEPEYDPKFSNSAQSCYRSPNGAALSNLTKYGLSDNYKNIFSGGGGFNHPSLLRKSMNFNSPLMELEMQPAHRLNNLISSNYSPNRGPEFCFPRPDFANSRVNPQFYRANASSNFPMGFGDDFSYSSHNRMNLNETTRNAFYMSNAVQSRNLTPRRVFTSEDGLIIPEEGRGYARLRGHNTTTNKIQEKMLSKCSSLFEIRGCVYPMAKDQHGCRFLQRVFDEGTCRDVQIVFEEIIDHVVELMMNPFGNYLMQKFLEVCNEEHRMHIVLRVTEEPGDIVRISLNTHGTRVVQKLIETLKTRQQISLVVKALEPGFLALIKDVNGNHVVQKCLQCFTTEDSKFIFIGAAKYCVDIGTQQQGCCVLQRCISHATGELHQNLVQQISANGLVLAQDAYGNYVVQFILELTIPSATYMLTSQFEGRYVHLSRQKFSSHVVEKCLLVCNDEIRSRIIHELISTTYFDQLLQDPHANYVVQTALRVTEGPVRDSLVHAIESYKAISRNSPYSKKIFSQKLLKR